MVNEKSSKMKLNNKKNKTKIGNKKIIRESLAINIQTFLFFCFFIVKSLNYHKLMTNQDLGKNPLVSLPIWLD